MEAALGDAAADAAAASGDLQPAHIRELASKESLSLEEIKFAFSHISSRLLHILERIAKRAISELRIRGELAGSKNKKVVFFSCCAARSILSLVDKKTRRDYDVRSAWQCEDGSLPSLEALLNMMRAKIATGGMGSAALTGPLAQVRLERLGQSLSLAACRVALLSCSCRLRAHCSLGGGRARACG